MVWIWPVLMLQGAWVRLTVPVLPEPPGPRQGSTGDGPPLRLLVVGDSAAAGVGAEHQDEALSGQLVSRLAPHFEVSWTLLAKSGNKTADTLAHLDELDAADFDVAVTSLGVNDAVARVSRAEWRAGQAELRRVLRDKFGVSTLVISGLPPVHEFPALPQPLRRYIGACATALNEVLEADIAADSNAHFIDLRFTADESQMASDGFHPGPAVYAIWAELVAAVIRDTRAPAR
jgi:lysophospholipase L1-like esterase